MTKKKDPNVYPKGWNRSRVERIIAHYDNQTEDESAAEIDSAPIVESTVWVEVPADLLPRVKKLIAGRRKSA